MIVIKERLSHRNLWILRRVQAERREKKKEKGNKNGEKAQSQRENRRVLKENE